MCTAHSIRRLLMGGVGALRAQTLGWGLKQQDEEREKERLLWDFDHVWKSKVRRTLSFMYSTMQSSEKHAV